MNRVRIFFWLMAVFSCSANANEITLPRPAKGVDIDYNNNSLVYYSLDEKSLVIIDYENKKQIITVSPPRVFKLFNFNESFLVLSVDAKISAYSKKGEKLELEGADYDGVFLSACRLSEEGYFAVLTLIGDKDGGKAIHSIWLMKLIENKLHVLKRIPQEKSGKLVFESKSLWFLTQDEAKKISLIDIPIDN